ncbi:MAG: CotH kinase family protein [Alistipes sp.]|nr:CotH kinase family protein [Alistipes sp.]
MKKERILVLLCTALAMCFFTSCSKDETAKDSFETIESTVVLPDMIDAETGTRSTIYDTEEGGISLWWAPKESIGVYGTRLTNKKFTSTNKYKDAATTYFSGATLFSSPKYAYYPYSADNNNSKQTAVKGNLPTKQDYSTTSRVLGYDYKVGTYESWSLSGSKFTFKNIITFISPRINATGTVLEGDKLEALTMEVTTADGQPRQIVGDFTFDLTTGTNYAITSWTETEGSNAITLQITDAPTLSANTTVVTYLTVGPNVKNGDIIKFTIRTDKHIATLKRTSKANYTPNLVGNYTLTLASVADLVIEDIEPAEPIEPEPDPEVTEIDLTLKSFKFEVAKNPGKILGRELYLDGVTTKGREVTEKAATIDEENKTITLYIPYLNNRKLVPTFEVAEGAVVMTDTGVEIDGVNEVDFTGVKQIGVVNPTSGDAYVYNLELTNTGLPVVVVNQVTDATSEELNNDYKLASEAWYLATQAKWVPKDADWPMTEDGSDNFMVYNADGTPAVTDKGGAVVESPIMASTRVRGNVTQQMPKKAFAVKLDAKSGVLGMPAHKRWVLLANWKDRTLMRNEVAFGLAKVFKQTLGDGMAWNPSGQHVELVYNGVHVGNYYLCEQIKIDGGRLDINDPYDKDDAFSGNAADYGYLLENDDAIEDDNSNNLMSTGSGDCWFYTANYIPFIFKDDLDQDGNSSSVIRNYVQDFVRGVEDNLYAGSYDTAFDKMDLASFVDYWLVQELMMNSETSQPKSCYMNINNGIISAGPLWDFDWNTLPVSGYSEKSYSYTKSMLEKASLYHRRSGYPTTQYKTSSLFTSTVDESYLWYPMLVKNAEFKALAAQRWNAVMGALQAYAATIPTMAQKIAKSADVNDDIWFLDNKSMNSNHRGTLYGIGGSYSQSLATRGYCGDEAMEFEAACENLMNMLNERINGMSYVSSQTWPSKSYSSSTK